MAWTDDRIALLEKMWTEGQSAAEIAKALGEGTTRNAVIGKAHRMGLSGRPSPIKKATTGAKKSTAKTTKAKAATKATAKGIKAAGVTAKNKAKETVPVKEKLAIKKLSKAPAPIKPTPRKVVKDGEYSNILDLTDRVCKWPIGDPRDEDFHFCIGPSSPGTPYCDEHTAMAYQVSTRGRKKINK
jgi:GcrA cell cycle regulator